MPNVYYEPEKLGLEIVGDLDEPGLSWEFNTLRVWKSTDGKVYYAQDSGCSCPSPFEDYNSISDLTEVNKETFEDFKRAVEAFPDTPADRFSLIEKVKALLF